MSVSSNDGSTKRIKLESDFAVLRKREERMGNHGSVLWYVLETVLLFCRMPSLLVFECRFNAQIRDDDDPDVLQLLLRYCCFLTWYIFCDVKWYYFFVSTIFLFLMSINVFLLHWSCSYGLFVTPLCFICPSTQTSIQTSSTSVTAAIILMSFPYGVFLYFLLYFYLRFLLSLSNCVSFAVDPLSSKTTERCSLHFWV